MDATEKRSITLTAAEWNTVLGVLEQAAYRIVAPIVGQIIEQANSAAPPEPAPKGREPGTAPQLVS